MNWPLNLYSTGLESELAIELVFNRFREWIGHLTCIQQVLRVNWALNLYSTGSESGLGIELVFNRFRELIGH